MNKNELNLLKNRLNLDIEEYQSTIFEQFKVLFLNKNRLTNLISKNDEKYFFEKHIYDSLAINLFFEKYNQKYENLLDIGTGGGLPSVPLSIIKPELKITAIDSIGKKIRFIEDLKITLSLENLIPINDRVENHQQKFDLITSRAVAKVEVLCKYALPLLKDSGYLILYKSKTVENEIHAAKKILDKFQAKVIDLIEYSLPSEETFIRNLVIITK